MNNYKYGIHTYKKKHTHTYIQKLSYITDIQRTHSHTYNLHVRYRAIRDTSVEDREQEDNTSAREHS